MPQFILDTGNAESHARFDALPEFMQGYIETAFFSVAFPQMTRTTPASRWNWTG